MNSDDLKIYAMNHNEGNSPARWGVAVKGKIVTGYAIRVTDTDLGEKQKFLPPTADDGKLNYCLQKKCDTQKSLLDTNSLTGNMNSWTATIKISAIMDQNVVKDFPLTQHQDEGVSYGPVVEQEIWVGLLTGEKCPDLYDVEEALKQVKVGWRKINSDWTEEPEERKLNEHRNCEDKINPKEGMKQGAGKTQDDADDGILPDWVEKEWEKEKKALPVRLFNYVKDGMSAALGFNLDHGLQVLNIVRDITSDPKYKFPDDPFLCECDDKGISTKCWKCKEVIIIDPITEEIETKVECEQTVKRDKDGNCPKISSGGKNRQTSYETWDDCMNYKSIDCPSAEDPRQ